MNPIHKCYRAMSLYFPRKSTCEPLVQIIEWRCMLRYLEQPWDEVNKLQACLCTFISSVHNPAASCAVVCDLQKPASNTGQCISKGAALMRLDLVVKLIKYVFHYIIPHILKNSYVIF